ncbi:hypothetical protein FBY35_0250 [Streptomyces sp. SLBN-118]|uniref:hypothetical protein n=1 Tax=Streptomyces sp. SLBN-118 TaxID=2768454 RepID=UPI00114F1AC6|nr:hypothetical protein [Streptomyces sp. SLBN-118]TQK49959.1 hypothetical protein FBY35_0250 [Streptomyces sp. SLBN-118]
MSLSLVVLAAWAVAFLTLNVILCVRVWRIRDLPTWRRLLPAALLCAALAASLTRAAGITVIASTVAFPLNVATLVVALGEIRGHRCSAGSPASEPMG